MQSNLSELTVPDLLTRLANTMHRHDRVLKRWHTYKTTSDGNAAVAAVTDKIERLRGELRARGWQP